MVFPSLLLAPAVLAQEPALHGRVVGVTDGDTRHHLLLAEFEHGRRWYVIAYLEGEDLDPFAGLSNINPAT